MQKNDFFFDLPKEQIAQEPLKPRDISKLMLLDRNSDEIIHKHFYNLLEILQPGDILVANDSKVIPARLIGQKQGGSAICEILLLKEHEKDVWECLAKPGKRLKEGHCVIFGDSSLSGEIISTLENGCKIVKFRYDTETLYEKLDNFGNMPLPPYITKQLQEKNDYQTVYAKVLGSSAAPTAGLHFTQELIEKLKNKGVLFETVTLHVGLGTFRPVQVENIEDHTMHSEWYSISKTTADNIKEAKENGNRIIAVGTTSCRTLESMFWQNGEIKESSGLTDIFIYPGKKLNVIDGLITNFHLPESTLIMLVSAFYGYEKTMKAYQVAIDEKYRFFSFGDAMIIL